MTRMAAIHISNVMLTVRSYQLQLELFRHGLSCIVGMKYQVAITITRISLALLAQSSGLAAEIPRSLASSPLS